VRCHFLAPLLRRPEDDWSLVHDATGRVLANRVHTAFDSRSRREGLLRQGTWPAGSALIIAPCQAVHTIGMRFPIDLVFVNRAGVVVKTRERVVPWRMAGAMRAFAVVEMPAGTLAGMSLEIGDGIAVHSDGSLAQH